ncbi:MAG: hypothetical protein E7294_09035 [Lachnospiraceae bacterium]|nr:hypothetical protein [Lachnospiraceae bacterium]
MRGFICFLIFAGSAILLFNIIRYYKFMKSTGKIESMAETKKILSVPFFFLMLFFLGYLFVGIFRRPDIVVAAILFGGSIYVFVMFSIMFFIVRKIRDSERKLNSLYAEMKNNLDALTQDSLTVFRVNLTKDLIEDRGGQDLYASDLIAQSYTDLMLSRLPSLLIRGKNEITPGLFSRDGLLAHYRAGHTSATEVNFVRRKSGRYCFVRMHAALAAQPGTDEVVAFITEQNYNTEMVNDTVLKKALVDQYDMITYLVGNEYGVVIGEKAQGAKGSLFPKSRYGLYEEFINEQVTPVLCGEEDEKKEISKALTLEVVEQRLEEKEPYEVIISCRIDGAVYYKKFVFYVVDKEARFYIFLKSDVTERFAKQMRFL